MLELRPGNVSPGKRQKLGILLGLPGGPPQAPLGEPFNAFDTVSVSALKQRSRTLCARAM